MPSRPDVRSGHPCPPLTRRWLRSRPPGSAGHLRRLEGTGNPSRHSIPDARSVRDDQVGGRISVRAADRRRRCRRDAKRTGILAMSDAKSDAKRTGIPAMSLMQKEPRKGQAFRRCLPVRSRRSEACSSPGDFAVVVSGVMVRPVVQAKHPGLLRVPPTGSSGFRQQPTGQEEQERDRHP